MTASDAASPAASPACEHRAGGLRTLSGWAAPDLRKLEQLQRHWAGESSIRHRSVSKVAAALPTVASQCACVEVPLQAVVESEPPSEVLQGAHTTAALPDAALLQGAHAGAMLQEVEHDTSIDALTEDEQATVGPEFSVTIRTMAGSSLELGGLSETMEVCELCQKVGLAFKLPAFAVRLLHGREVLHISCEVATLKLVGVVHGVELVLVKQWGWAKPDLRKLAELQRHWSGQ